MLKEIAIKYHSYGLNAVPANAAKVPIYGWDEKGALAGKPYQSMFFEAEKHNLFEVYPNLSIVTGEISGNLEVLDFDTKYYAPAFDEFMTELVNSFPELVEKLVIESTPSGGKHIYYRCAGIGGCQKLAGRVVNGKKLYFIESKANGGLCTCYPSPNYSLVQGDLKIIQKIEVSERNILIAIARGLSQIEISQDMPYQFVDGRKTAGDNAFARYNASAKGRELSLTLLLRAGFKKKGNKGDKVLLLHPDSKHNEPNAIYGGKGGGLYVWGNCSIVEPEKYYSPVAILILLMANGDKKKAYEIITANGF